MGGGVNSTSTGTTQAPVSTGDNNNNHQVTGGGSGSVAVDDDKRFGSRYPDTHQIFVGNLQPDISEEDLKEFFGKHGKVLEVRINTNNKQPTGKRVPNYGFIVFEAKETVENLLKGNKPTNLLYKNDKGVEHRLNIEEKRAKQGGGGGGGGKSGNRGNRSSSNGSKGGNKPSGGSGGMKQQQPQQQRVSSGGAAHTGQQQQQQTNVKRS